MGANASSFGSSTEYTPSHDTLLSVPHRIQELDPEVFKRVPNEIILLNNLRAVRINKPAHDSLWRLGTISDLKRELAIAAHIPTNTPITIFLGDLTLKDDVLLSDVIPISGGSIVLAAACISTKLAPFNDNLLVQGRMQDNEPIMLFIKGISDDHMMTVTANASETLRGVVQRVEKMFGGEFRYAGGYSRGQTLRENGITSGATLSFSVPVPGGSASFGIPFADVSDPSTIHVRQWSTSAPKWRIAGRGLNMEGVCTNTDCSAYNRQVIMPIGFTGKSGFDIRADVSKCVCPICSHWVHPNTCSFNNCWWRVQGYIIDDHSGKKVDTHEMEARDEYSVFDVSKQALWHTLWIIATEKKTGHNPQYADCAACQGKVAPGETARCSCCDRECHTYCLAVLFDGKCPTCNLVSQLPKVRAA